MPLITFKQADGREQAVQAATGSNLMQIATGAGVPGIVAECGGSAMCATCHVYVDAAWLGQLPQPLATELEMLECTAAERLPNSRLSCQIKATDSLDGLVIHVPARQY